MTKKLSDGEKIRKELEDTIRNLDTFDKLAGAAGRERLSWITVPCNGVDSLLLRVKVTCKKRCVAMQLLDDMTAYIQGQESNGLVLTRRGLIHWLRQYEEEFAKQLGEGEINDRA